MTRFYKAGFKVTLRNYPAEPNQIRYHGHLRTHCLDTSFALRAIHRAYRQAGSFSLAALGSHLHQRRI